MISQWKDRTFGIVFAIGFLMILILVTFLPAAMDAAPHPGEPEAILVEVYRNSVLYGIYEIRADGGWVLEISGLPGTDEIGDPYTYSVIEQAVDGYEAEIFVQSIGAGEYFVFLTNRAKGHAVGPGGSEGEDEWREGWADGGASDMGGEKDDEGDSMSDSTGDSMGDSMGEGAGEGAGDGAGIGGSGEVLGALRTNGESEGDDLGDPLAALGNLPKTGDYDLESEMPFTLLLCGACVSGMRVTKRSLVYDGNMWYNRKSNGMNIQILTGGLEVGHPGKEALGGVASRSRRR
ncbi:MAG: Cna B-type domain-containing protein [Clostridiales bacterium]|nr:Cna B-type domain-containing protein [Clostridiales bacterium]